jgi:hypothetical protein
LALCGLIAIDAKTAAVTVSVVEPLIAPTVALMLELPVATPVAKPADVIVATVGVAELHVAVVVTSFVLLSL